MFGAASLTDAVVCAAAEGSREHLGRVCEALQLQIRLMVIARLSPTPDQLHGVEDITQDIFLALSSGIVNLANRTVGGLKAFLSTIASRKVAAWISDRQRWQRARAVSLDETVASLSNSGALWQFLSAGAASPRTIAEQADLIKKVLTALGQMKPMDRDIITEAVFDQLSTRELAEIHGITREAAYMRFKRAVDKLRGMVAVSHDFRGSSDGSA